MKDHEISRRSLIRTAATTTVIGALGISSRGVAQVASATEKAKHQLTVAGYDYDRVRAIMDAQVGIADTDISFDVEDIYSLSRSAFGPDPKCDVTEIGLLPYIRRSVNDDFRA